MGGARRRMDMMMLSLSNIAGAQVVRATDPVHASARDRVPSSRTLQGPENMAFSSSRQCATMPRVT